MKPLLVFFLMLPLVLAGCATTRTGSQSQQPQLISMTSLPSISAAYSSNGLKLNVLFHVRDDGSVTDVRLMESSGDTTWDNTAIDSMKLWRFSAFQDLSQAGRWIRNTIVLQIQAPTILTLGELISKDPQEADSLYSLCANDMAFDTLLKQNAPGTAEPLGKIIGAVDIARYPEHVREALRKLGINQITHPLRLGTRYFIFKRYKPDGTLDSPL